MNGIERLIIAKLLMLAYKAGWRCQKATDGEADYPMPSYTTERADSPTFPTFLRKLHTAIRQAADGGTGLLSLSFVPQTEPPPNTPRRQRWGLVDMIFNNGNYGLDLVCDGWPSSMDCAWVAQVMREHENWVGAFDMGDLFAPKDTMPGDLIQAMFIAGVTIELTPNDRD